MKRPKLLEISADAGRGRRAVETIEQDRPAYEVALRRALPFLLRRGAPMRLESVRLASVTELREELPAPLHFLDIVTEPGGSPGLLIMDAGTCALCIDAVLGGDGQSLPRLSPEGLSFAQRALVNRVADGVIAAFSDALFARTGLKLAKLGTRSSDALGETSRVICNFVVGEPGQEGRLILALEKDALLGPTVTAKPQQGADPRVVATLGEVEIDVVVELGRLRMKLGEVPKIKVGDTLRLDLPVEGQVRVFAAGQLVAKGHPTRVGERVAIRIG